MSGQKARRHVRRPRIALRDEPVISRSRMMNARRGAAYDRFVTGTARGQALTARAVGWYSGLSPRRRELVQDGTLALVLAILNLLSLLPYQSQMHPAWLAFFLVTVQCAPLT